MNIHVAGENALMVYFADNVSDQTSLRIQQTASVLSQYMGKELIDLVPSYASMLVVFDAFKTDHLHVRKLIRDAAQPHQESQTQQQENIVRLPVYYGPQTSPDLAKIAQHAGLTNEQVIEIHQQAHYRVYAIGFAPGFAYLGETDERIAMARLSTPRKKVPKGAVAIADRQTAVYPSVSPGGWNLIGCCPTPMFDANASPSMPVKAGDAVQFYAIDESEFISLGGSFDGWQDL
ncbi:5-oxoprolinase subunit PxpB [Bermanella sp. WJH001]|uniref:5-oxoprolinase subunit PxpB n=1 Tax=Bermanella sp. WJH001 TaxID=3048005 RepID=UPI0024BE55F6|nr:5-oxoprolinase subunit PxpB [Bermanella sp. WJH001]MDJ1539052.1 5-oxoprolinase subunit PxpB [Bermanella sp. WJH001]